MAAGSGESRLANELFVVEATRTGWEHAGFNAAVLQALGAKAARTGDQITVYCEYGQWMAISALLGGSVPVLWKRIRVVDGSQRKFVRKFFSDCLGVGRVLVEARRRNARVVLLSVFPNVLAVILLLKGLLNSIRLHVVLHGEIESLVIEEKQRIDKEGFWARLALLRMFDGSWPTLYVLGNGIRRRLLARFLRKQQQLVALRSMNHPYIFAGHQIDRQSPGKISFRVGFVGAGRIVKGVDLFFALADLLHVEIGAGKLECILVGGLERAARKFCNSYVRVLGNRVAALTSEEYQRAIGSLDCAVFLSRHDYAFTASGSALDVIDQDLEILSLRNHYLGDLASLDDEGGIKFFNNVSEIATEISRRVNSGVGFRRFSYNRIKAEYASDMQNIMPELFGAI